MTQIEWDPMGDRTYETGIDRGVLYLPDNTTVPWSGLTGFDETAPQENTAFYQDGLKIAEQRVLGDFVGKIRAISYPDELEAFHGNKYLVPGIHLQDQRPGRFGFSYRTLVGNDLQGSAYGYKIHLLYNITATQDTVAYKTLNDSSSPFEFSWTVTAVPEQLRSFRPTARVVIDSTKLEPGMLDHLEKQLYGSPTSDPYLPSLQDLVDLIAGRVIIKDNGDGTWTATSFGFDDPITMLDDTTFQITDANAVYLAPDTYLIETSEV